MIQLDSLSTAEALRLRCLELAISLGRDPVEDARAFYAFVSGEDEKTPRDRILQAMEDAGVR